MGIKTTDCSVVFFILIEQKKRKQENE